MAGNDLLEAVGALHVAATDNSLWPVAFERLSLVMQANGLLIGRMPHRAGSFDLTGHRIDPAIVDRINGPLASREANPVFNSIPRSPTFGPVIASNMIDENTLLHSRVYQEAMRPANLRYTIAAVLDCDEERSYVLAFGRDEATGDFGREDTRIFSRLLPHIIGAINAQHALATTKGELSVLELLDRGVVMLDGAGRPTYFNREAQRIFDDGDGLQLRSSGLVASLPSEERKLRALLANTTAMGRDGQAVSIARPSGRLPYSLIALPIRDREHVLPAIGSTAHTVMFVRDPHRESGQRAEWLMQLYGLTVTEALIALDLHEGQTPAEIAGRRGVSNNTLKSHMKAIFSKMDVTRQTDLVRLTGLALGDLRAG